MARKQVSNSKLTDLQKEELRAFKEDYPRIEFVSYGRVTLAIDWDNMLVGFSAASPTEKKFRRKVGEYHAMRRLDTCAETFTEYHNTNDLFIRAYRAFGI